MEQSGQQRKFFSGLGLAYTGGSILIYAVQLLALGLVRWIRPGLLDNMNIYLIVAMGAMYLLGMPLMAKLIRRIPAAGVRRGRRMSAGELFCAFLMAYAILYLSNIIGMILTAMISLIKRSAVENSLLGIVMEGNPLLLFLLMAVCAPVWEELLFRKLLVDRAVRYGEGTAILLSGLMFGLFHGNLSQFVYAFSLGAFLAFVYVRTGRIQYTMLLHALVNAVSVLASCLMKLTGYDRMLEALLRAGSPEEMMRAIFGNMSGIFLISVYAALIMAVVLTGAILMLTGLKRFRLRPASEPAPGGHRAAAVIGNPGMIAFILFWLIMIIRQLMA